MVREALKNRKWSIKRRIFTEDNPMSAAGRANLGNLQIEIEFTLEIEFL